MFVILKHLFKIRIKELKIASRAMHAFNTNTERDDLCEFQGSQGCVVRPCSQTR